VKPLALLLLLAALPAAAASKDQCSEAELAKIYEVWGKNPEKELAEIYAKLTTAARNLDYPVALALSVQVHAERPKGVSWIILPDRFADAAAFSPAGEMSVSLGPSVLRVGCGFFEWLGRDYDDHRITYRMRDQAAFVLAHELGHNMKGHLRQMAAARDKGLTGAALDKKQFSLEREADVFGVRLACAAGFEPRAGHGAMMNAVPFFKKLGVTASDSHGGFLTRAYAISKAGDCCAGGVLDAACVEKAR
jgi:hypothetical protein